MIKVLVGVLLAFSLCLCCFAAVLSSAQLPLEARNADGSSEEEEVISSSYVLPNQIFNNGKPYYAGKDPISGQLDFNIKKPADIDSTLNEVIDPKDKAIISSSSPNIHDFLNLPVKYSSSKFVYPLVSSSYANLKYQGSNKNFITHKKPTQVLQEISIPSYHTANYYTVPTTKLTPVARPAAANSTSNSTAYMPVTTSTKKPISTSNSTHTTSAATSPSMKTTTTAGPTTTKKNPIIKTSVSVQSSNSSQKYTNSTSKPALQTTPLTPHKTTYQTSTIAPTVSTTSKKFVHHKKYSTSPPETTKPSLRFPDQESVKPHTSPRPTSTSAVLVTMKSTNPTKTTPSMILTEDPPTALPSSPSIPDLDAADVYHSLGQKNAETKFNQKPTMTLADIFNSLVEEESAVAANNPMNQGLDAQGNLMEPLNPSTPSPFAMHNNGPVRNREQAFGSPLQQQFQSHQEPSVMSGSQENFSNEYVSYQVQKPNIVQYRPALGTMNNVVISPSQNSASFILGSQQQVNQNAFGTIEKEPLFSKEQPIQYGTVISENISNIKRPPAASGQTTYQEMPSKTTVSNLHQNGHFNSNQEGQRQDFQRPSPVIHDYQQLPPAPPSPYQQLPLIRNIRKQSNNPTYQKAQNQPQAASKPIGFSQSTKHQENVESSIILGSNQDTKELLVSTNIRFPADNEQSLKSPSMTAINSPPSSPQVNGHAQPLSLQQIQNSNVVTFPKQGDIKSQQNELIYQHTPNSNADSVQIQKHEVLTVNQHQQKLTFPNANDPNIPAQHMVPPPLPNSLPSEKDLQKTTRPHGGSQYTYNDFTRKPVAGITRPNPDRHLPNILPQFRPNAKISTGHLQQANYNQEPGNIRVSTSHQQKRGAINSNPQFSHRRQPLGGQPKRYPLTRMTDHPPNELASRRIYRVPGYGGVSAHYLDRSALHVRRPITHNLRPAESTTVERHVLAPVLEKLPAFAEEDLVIDDPPQSVSATKDSNLFTEAKLEPVVTLQMLQSQKKTISLPTADSGDGEIQVPDIDNEETDAEDDVKNDPNELYVVYPIKTGPESEKMEAAETENSLPAVAVMDPPTGSDYQNTPFSIIRDRQQEPVLKNKKLLSLQQQNKAQQNKDSFPYPIETPDPSYNELNTIPRVSGVVIAPKNNDYSSATEPPIAIAYTPTDPSIANHLQLQQQKTIYSNINLSTAEIKEAHRDIQSEEAINGHDYDLRGKYYEKDFMAPFYPSVSLDSVTIIPTNDWNVLSSSTDSNSYAKNKIDRSDDFSKDSKDHKDMPDTETSTKSFELDNFQPELQGGFKPIYPPGYKLDNEQDEQDQMHQHETNHMPLALASRMDQAYEIPQQNLKTKSTISSIATTTLKPSKGNETTEENVKVNPNEISTSTAKPTKRTKSKFETSLAALLFGDDEEDVPIEQTQARQEPTKTMMSGPRSMPRMGPRSLKI